ncbi:hypothetical protein HanIR_Chr02g0088811 [Helianthus annuus]|nr:hypothetical protein HanIR_Chr02g0088811 [Helianthus annuus]
MVQFEPRDGVSLSLPTTIAVACFIFVGIEGAKKPLFMFFKEHRRVSNGPMVNTLSYDLPRPLPKPPPRPPPPRKPPPLPPLGAPLPRKEPPPRPPPLPPPLPPAAPL